MEINTAYIWCGYFLEFKSFFATERIILFYLYAIRGPPYVLHFRIIRNGGRIRVSEKVRIRYQEYEKNKV